MKLSQAEDKVCRLLRQLPGPKRLGSVTVHASTDSLGLAAQCQVGLLRPAHPCDVLTTLEGRPGYERTQPTAFDTLFEASNAEPYGPFYVCRIEINDDRFKFQYHWMHDPALTPSTAIKTQHGGLPSFLFLRKINRDLLEADTNNDIYFYLQDIVYLARERNLALHDDLIDFYAIMDWTTDCTNGSWDQYFARVTDGWTVGEFSRHEMYQRVLRGCRTIGHAEAEQLFSDAVAHYAHLREFVEQGRVLAGVPAVPFAETTDIFARFDDICFDLQDRVCDHMKRHAERYEIDLRAA